MPAGLRPQLVELGGGNPADLVELASALTAEQRSGRAPLPEVLPARSAGYAAALAALSPSARLLAVSAAAESAVEFPLLARDFAADDTRAAATLCGTLSKVARSTLYAAAPVADRRRAHALLAGLLAPPNATWHRAMATDAPNEELAAELAGSATGDHATSARQLERAAALTAATGPRADRLLAAAAHAWQAGRPGWARLLLSRANTPAAALLHGEIELRDGDPAVATHELTTAAAALPDPTAALLMAGEARRLSGDLRGYRALARTAESLAGRVGARPGALMVAHFRGLTATFAGRHDVAAEPLRHVIRVGLDRADTAAAVWAAEAAFALGQGERAHECAAAAVGRARLADEPAALPWALVYLSLSALVLDRHPCAQRRGPRGSRRRTAQRPHGAPDPARPLRRAARRPHRRTVHTGRGGAGHRGAWARPSGGHRRVGVRLPRPRRRPAGGRARPRWRTSPPA